MKKITLSDIAAKTGFSVNTISHALKNKPDISEATKEIIVKTANEMGYIQNSSASALRSGKSKSVAIIVGDISNPHFSIIVKEMESKLREYGYNAFVINTDENEELERAAIISAISKNVDGILICPVQKTTKNIDFLNSGSLPYVLFGRTFNSPYSSYVICDDKQGGFAAAEHLINLNHKNILFINASSYISSAKDRLCGILSAFEKYKIDKNLLKTEECYITGNFELVTEILNKHSDCTGIICFSDLIAMEVCHALKVLGKSVPDDISVIGFDNIASKYYFPLMLTSVTSSKTKMSIKSVDTLMDIIEGNSDNIHHILNTHVVVRESTKKI